jgi:translin
MKSIEREIAKMTTELKRSEGKQDELLRLTRELVRECSIGIKLAHSWDLPGAEAQLSKAKAMVQRAKKLEGGFKHITSQSYQEYAEIAILMAIVKRKEPPTHRTLKIPFESYMTGLMDCVGELRRQMLEELRKGRREEADYYFEEMSRIYEATLPLRFSNSILPNFRKKQDVARAQVESARSELLRGR